MNITYDIDINKNSIKLFGTEFVKNNINNCFILIDGQHKKIGEKLILNEEQKSRNLLEIKLIETYIITNMSYMFYECSLLNSLPDISEWDTKNIINMSHMFKN